MAAAVPPQLFLIGIQFSLRICMQPLILRRIDIAFAGQGSVAVIVIDKRIEDAALVSIGLIGRIRTGDQMLQALKAGLQAGIGIQHRSKLCLQTIELCCNVINSSILSIITRLIANQTKVQICLCEQIHIAAGLCQSNVLVDQGGQGRSQSIEIQRALCILCIVQTIAGDLGRYSQVGGCMFSKCLIPSGQAPGIGGHDTLADQIVVVSICQVAINIAFACFHHIPPNTHCRLDMHLIGQGYIVDMYGNRNLHIGTVDSQGCSAGVSTGSSALHIQVHPNASILACGDLILTGGNGCILGNQGIRISTVITIRAVCGVVHLVCVGPVRCISTTGYGHIVLDVNLKGPRRNDVTLLIFQVAHRQRKRGNIEIGA